jgi:hypothetical protein
MSFHITHRLGKTARGVTKSAFPSLLEELEADTGDVEHASVAVTHESEWCLEVYKNGYIVFENLESDEPRHMRNVPAQKIIALWELLADGNLDAIETEPWQQGY